LGPSAKSPKKTHINVDKRGGRGKNLERSAPRKGGRGGKRRTRKNCWRNREEKNSVPKRSPPSTQRTGVLQSEEGCFLFKKFKEVLVWEKNEYAPSEIQKKMVSEGRSRKGQGPLLKKIRKMTGEEEKKPLKKKHPAALDPRQEETEVVHIPQKEGAVKRGDWHHNHLEKRGQTFGEDQTFFGKKGGKKGEGNPPKRFFPEEKQNLKK